jgi:hypothetical protein
MSSKNIYIRKRVEYNMGKSKLKITIVSSKTTEKKIKELLYQTIADHIFESPDFQRILETSVTQKVG